MTQARDLADGKFDTSTLVVDAANNRVGIGTASPSNQLHLSQSGNANAIQHIQAGVNGYAARIKLTGNNAGGSSYNAIQSFVNGDSTPQWEITGPEASAEDVMTLHTGGTERMRIDTSVKFDNLAGLTTNGNVTITPNGTGIFVPKKVPSFYAYNSSAQSISDQTWTRVTLDSELFDTCSNFNTSNGRFTAPVNGIYSFTTVVNFGTDTASGGYVYVDVLKTTAGGSATQYYTMGMRLTSQVITNDTQINGSILLPLGQDDYVQLGAYQDVASGNVGLNGGRCYLTGHLVSGT